MNMDISELTLDDLQQQHREYAEVIGLDNLIKLADTFGGSSIYVPQTKELIKNKIYNKIYQEFDGSNLQELTQKYGVSKSTVYKVVQDKIGKSTWNLPGQMSIFDWGNDSAGEK